MKVNLFITILLLTKISIIYTQTIQLPTRNLCEGEWHLVFNDEFNGSSIDQNKWINYYPFSATGSDNGCYPCRIQGNIYYSNNNVTVQNGKCTITPTNENGVWVGHNYSATSGVLYSFNTFKYGRFEIMCKWPNNPTTRPAGWTLGQGVIEEIDVFERLCGNTTQFQSSYHWDYPAEDEDLQDSDCHTASSDLTTTFHKYAIEWDSFFIKWYIDDVLVKTYSGLELNNNRVYTCQISNGTYFLINNFPKHEAHLIMNLGCSGNEFDLSSQNAPHSMEIEYVRFYQKHIQSGLSDLCPIYNFTGDQLICASEQKEYTIDQNLQSGMTWAVSSNLNIISSDDNSIIVSVVPNSNPGEGWIRINAATGDPCLYLGKKLLWIGNPPQMSYDFNYNCFTRCYKFIPKYNSSLGSYTINGTIQFNSPGSGSMTLSSITGCPGQPNYTLSGVFVSTNRCGNTMTSFGKDVWCSEKKFKLNPSITNNIINWEIEDESNIATNNLTQLLIVNENSTVLVNLPTNGVEINETYQLDTSEFMNGTYYFIALYDDGEIVEDSFIVQH